MTLKNTPGRLGVIKKVIVQCYAKWSARVLHTITCHKGVFIIYA